MLIDSADLDAEMVTVVVIFLVGVIFQMGATWSSILSQKKILAKIEAVLERQDSRIDAHDLKIRSLEVEHAKNHPAVFPQ